MSRLKILNEKEVTSNTGEKYPEPIEDLKKLDESTILIRKGPWLICYKPEPNSSSPSSNWIPCGHLKLYPDTSTGKRYDVKTYPWTITRKFFDNSPIIVIRHFEGLRFYTLGNGSFSLLAEDLTFNVDTSGRNVLLGDFYTPEKNALGVMDRKVDGETSFYGVLETNFKPESEEAETGIVQSVASELNVQLDPQDGWQEAGSRVYITKLDGDKKQDSILLRTAKGVQMFKFDQKFKLQKTLEFQLKKPNQLPERLYFGHVTGGTWQDVIQLDDTGITLYQYQKSSKSYRPVAVNQDLSKARGWTPEHWDTVRILDVDGDGLSEIVSNGPAGLTALKYQTSNFINILTDMGTRSSGVGVVNSTLFLQGPGNAFKTAELQAFQEPSTTTSKPKPPFVSTTLRPSNIEVPATVIEPPIATDRRWLEQWSPAQLFKDAVDLGSGQLGFNVPLVSLLDVSTWALQCYASYSSQSQRNGFLGQGWSIPLAQDFIYLDKRQSVFPVDFTWYLVSNGNPNELKSTRTEGDLQYFSFVDEKDDQDPEQITAVYNATREHWIVEGKLEKSVYGAADADGAADALQWSLEWPNWSLSATDVSTARPVVTGWYLNRRFDKARKADLFYFYEEKKASLQGAEYTSEVLLSTIEEPLGIKVSFSYGKKTSSEYKEPKLVDKEGQIHLPTSSPNRHYLDSCTIKTKKLKQAFKFDYTVVDGDNGDTRLLKSINQDLVSGHQDEILQLDYTKLLGNHVATSLKSGGLTFKYDFEEQTSMSPLAYHNNEIKYLTRDVPTLAIGPDYTVLAYKHFDADPQNNAVALKVLNRQMTREVTTLYASNLTSTFQDFALEAYKNRIIVIAATKTQKLLLTFLRTKAKWSETPSRVVLSASDSQIELSEDTVAVQVPKSSELSIYNWDTEAKNWIPTSVNFSSPITNFVPSSRFFIISDGTNLHVAHPTNGTSWTTKLLRDDPFRISNNTINRFDMDDKLRTELKAAFAKYSVHVLGNFVATTSFEETGDYFQLTHKLYLLDAEFQPVKEQTFVTLRDRLEDITETSENAGTTLKLGYVKEGDTIKTKVVDIWGKDVEAIDKLEDAEERAEQKKEVLKSFNDSKDFQKDIKKNFLLGPKWEKYTVEMTHQGLRCGRDDVIYKYTGGNWISSKEPVSTSGPLGLKLILEVSNWADGEGFRTAKLFGQTSEGEKGPLQETVKFQVNLVNRFPAYLASQKTVEIIDLLIFDSEGNLEDTHLFRNEIVMGSSDHQNLITFRNNTSTDQLGAYECVVRPTSTMSPKPQLFVSNMTISDGTIERRTGYKRSFEVSHSDRTYTETGVLIPGADETISGRYEASRILHVPTGNITTSEKWFDSAGEAVLAPVKKKENAEKKTSKSEIDDYRKKFQLMDSSNSVMIALTTPFDLADNVVSYYGFEPYEVNRIGNLHSNNTWTMANAAIVRGRRALTGDSFLKLEATGRSTAKISGFFAPKQTENSFIFSAWIRRPDGVPLVGQTEEALSVQLRNSEGLHIVKLYGSVKRRLGDWAYVELPLYSDSIVKIYSKFIEYKQRTEPQVQFKKTLELVAEIEAPPGTSVDVDHVKFTPFPLDMDVNVYNENRKLTAVIKPDGRIQRTVYNRNLQEIATIDEYGQVEQLKSTSKSDSLSHIQGSIFPNPHGSAITLEPETGHLETWTKNSFGSRWLLDSSAGWTTSKTHLRHTADSNDFLWAVPNLFDSESAALRFYVHLQDPTSFVSLIWNTGATLKLARQPDDSAKLSQPNGPHIQKLPTSGEVIAFADSIFLWLWFDGLLLIDSATIAGTSQDPWSGFRIEAKGQVTFEDLFVLNKPQITIEYSNSFGEKLQTIKYEDTQTVLITETLFDELGRDAITTKTTRVRQAAAKPLLAFCQNFVTNDSVDPDSTSSVWKTGNLTGLVSDLNKNDNGAPFLRTLYAPNPLNQEAEIGLPGTKYTTGSKFSTKINFDSDIAAVHILFPPNQGFQHTTELTPSGTKKISVFNNRGLQVASYSKSPGYDHFLSTNEYDDQDRLVKVLPPLYHEYVNTTKTANPKLYQNGEAHLSTEERNWQKLLGTWYTYDDFDRLTKKVTPDTGVTEFLYDRTGQQRLMLISMASGAQPEEVVFFDYDNQQQMVATGTLHYPQTSDQLKNITANTVSWAKSPNHLFQSFDYSDDHVDPSKRGRVKNCITNDGYTVVADTFLFDTNGQLIKKGTTSDAFTPELSKLSTFKREFKRNLLKSVTYPIKIDNQPLQIHYSYNRLGQLTGLGSEQDPTKYMAFAYLPTGELAEERFWPGTSGLDFTREYSYNSPGFLEKISDPFMTQDIAYEHGGYAQEGYGGGLVMKTQFNASWTSSADERWFRVQEQEIDGDFAGSCHKALKAQGYLSGSGEPVNEYNINGIDDMPVVCTGETGHKISSLMAQKQRPIIYGHQYAYGSHQELIKAKYFTEATEHLVQPLRPTTFASELGVSEMQSELIWNSLKASSHIATDQRLHDQQTAIGSQGLPLVDRPKLLNDLKSLDMYYAPFFLVIEKYLLNSIGNRKSHNATDFEEKFLRWDKVLPTSPMPIKSVARGRAKRLAAMLKTKDYFPTEASGFINGLVSSFTKELESFTSKIPEIIKILNTKFNLALGESPFDLKSFQIDANGNHKLFYSGYNHYKLEYHKGRNQFKKVKRGTGFPFERPQKFAEISRNFDTILKPTEYTIAHDSRGNIMKALHKGISKITYHPVSQRPMDILKTDGTRLVFIYDAKGERVSKRVFGPNGSLSLAKFYLRDETGQVVVDHEVHYRQGSSPIVLTSAYVYGPRGLLGFWRNNKFYSVFTDHVGSIRLVIHKGRVVAFYDYLPYGDLMRSFGSSDPEVNTSYRFTGQEWDSETGLYNFHARLYDPSIGRFFQPDPKSQYFSPYIYGGNSPLSGVDPDGEFFLTLSIIIGAVVGAYLGGVAANEGKWNLVKWDWKDQKTYFGIFGGALVGALVPVYVVASVKTIAGISIIAALGKPTAFGIGIGITTALGVGGAYLNAATDFGWDPTKWDWTDGRLYNELFVGFGTGSGLVGGIGQFHNYAGKIASPVGRRIFISLSYGVGGTVAYLIGVAANDGKWDVTKWEWNKAKTWNALLSGFDAGNSLPQNVFQISKGTLKLLKSTKEISKLRDLSKLDKLLQVLKNAKHGAGKTAGALVMGYYMGVSANGDLDITKWKNEWSTYQNVLSGVFYGKDFANTLAYAKKRLSKPPPVAESKAFIKNFSKNSASILRKIVGHKNSRKNTINTSLMSSLFAAAIVGRKFLLQGLPESVQQEAEKFVNNGKSSYDQGISKPPAALQKYFDALTEAEIAKTGFLGDINVDQLFIDRNAIQVAETGLKFLTCEKSQRKKRAVQNCLGQEPDFSTYLELDYTETGRWNRDFQADPWGFMSRNVVSSSYVGSSLDGPRSRMGLNQLESGIQNFVLAKTRDGSGYLFIPAGDAPSTIHSEAFPAWYVPTGTSLLVPQLQANSTEPRILITDQLDGSTIYFRTGTNGTLEVYHHNHDRHLTQLSDGNFVVSNNQHRFQLVNWQFDPQVQTTLLQEIFHGIQDQQSQAIILPADSVRRYHDASGRFSNNPVFGFETFSRAISAEVNSDGSVPIRKNVVTYWDNGWKAVTNLHRLNQEPQFPLLTARNSTNPNNAEIQFVRQELRMVRVEPTPPKIDIPETAVRAAVHSDFGNFSASGERRRRRRAIVSDIGPTPSTASPFAEKSSWLSSVVAWIPTWSLPGSEGHNSNSNFSSPRPTPSILEMGDSLLNSTDWYGNLTWASLLVYKITGQRPYSSEAASSDFHTSTLTSIKAADIVEGFVQLVDGVTEVAGLDHDAAAQLDYFRLVTEVKRMLQCRHEADRIPEYLLEVLLKSLQKTLYVGHVIMEHFDDPQFLENVKHLVALKDT